MSPLALALMPPQPAQARPGTVAPTNVLGAYQLSTQAAEQNYQNQLQAQDALWGGLASLGTAGILGAAGVPSVQGLVGKLFTPNKGS